MTEFHVEVVRVGPIEKHPNADSLSITRVHGGYPCIFRTGDFQEGDLAVYIPIDCVLPDTELFSFLKDSDRRRLKAKKLRGVFSMGLLVAAPEGVEEGADVADLLGITKYEPPVRPAGVHSYQITGGECEAAPKGWFFPTYTDIEGLRRYPDVLQEGEEVVISEKIHGANGRDVHDGDRLWVGSRTQIKREDDSNLWWQVARALDLENRLKPFPFLVFFGEVYGPVQDLPYGHAKGQVASFRVFDVFDIKAGRYLDHDDAQAKARAAGLDWVPELYRGPWSADLMELAEGRSTLADHVREGIVVKPVKERWHDKCGRVILKLHGQGYLLRKQKR